MSEIVRKLRDLAKAIREGHEFRHAEATANALEYDADKVVDLEQNLEALRQFTEKDVWYYQGDGDDHVESLTIPVVILPQELAAKDAEIARLSKLVETAYRSGYAAGYADGEYEHTGGYEKADDRWQESAARRALEESNERE